MRAEICHVGKPHFHKNRDFSQKSCESRERRCGLQAARLSGSGPAFGAHVRTIPEIPALVVDAHGSNVLRNKRNFGVTPDLDNAALAYDNLFEASTVLKLHCDDLVSDAGFRSSFQLIETGFRNRK
jgi:hypothetical protein